MTDSTDTGAPQPDGLQLPESSATRLLAGRITLRRYLADQAQARAEQRLFPLEGEDESEPQLLVEEGVGASPIVDASALEGGFHGGEVAQSRSQEELDREAFERDWATHPRGIEHE